MFKLTHLDIIKAIVFVALIVISLILTGCSDKTPEDTWHTYNQRLANIAEIDLPAPPKITLLPRPDLAQFIQPITQTKIKLVDALKLKECNLQTYIGERNSSLGKVQDPTNRLIYEFNLLNQLAHCDSSNQLIATVYQEKLISWPLQLNNYLVQSEESKKLLQPNHTFMVADNIGFTNTLTYLSSLLALTDYTRRLQDKNTEHAIENVIENSIDKTLAQNLSQSVQAVYDQRFLSSLIYTMEVVINQMQTTQNIIQQQLNKPLCRDTFKPKSAEYLQNVFLKYYGSELQTHLASLYKMQQQIAPLVALVWQDHPIQKTEFGERYLTTSEKSIYNLFEAAISQHSESWQNLYKICNLQHIQLSKT